MAQSNHAYTVRVALDYESLNPGTVDETMKVRLQSAVMAALAEDMPGVSVLSIEVTVGARR